MKHGRIARGLHLLLIVQLALPEVAAADGDGSTYVASRGSTGVADDATPADAARVGRNGDASYRYPIEVPPGTNGVTPRVELRYSSDRTGDSWVGYGWALNLGVIQRSLVEGVPSYDSSDSFVLDGEDLVPTGAPGRFVPKRQPFVRVEHLDGADDHWEVRTRDGRIARYGVHAGARVTNSGGSVFAWHLEEIEDVHGNVVAISYDARDPGVRYPSEVRYTLRRTISGDLESLNGMAPPQGVDRALYFDLEPRPDPSVSYLAGLERRLQHRLLAIRATVGSFETRRYELFYGPPSPDTTRSLLREIREFAAGGIPAEPRVTSFGYRSNVESGTEGWIEVPGSGWESQDLSFTFSGFDDGGTRIADVNGDALPDLIRAVRQDNQSQVDAESGVYLNDGAGFGPKDPSWVLPAMSSGLDVAFLAEETLNYGTIVGDFDRDGRADLLVANEGLLPGSGLPTRQTREDEFSNTGTGWQLLRSRVQPPYQLEDADFDELIDSYPPAHAFSTWHNSFLSWSAVPGRTLSGDLNGDGRPDLLTHDDQKFEVCIDISEPLEPPQLICQYDFASTTHYSLRASDGTGLGEPSDDRFRVCPDAAPIGNECKWRRNYSSHKTIYSSFSTQPSTYRRWGKRLVDVNSDRLADFLILYELGYDQAGPQEREVLLNRGNDFESASSWTFPEGMWLDSRAENVDDGVRFVDFNGDGRLDLLRGKLDPCCTPAGAWINTGNPAAPWQDLGAASPWLVPGAQEALGMSFVSWEGRDRGVRVADLDGNGMPDLIRLFGEILTRRTRVFLNRGEVPDLLVSVDGPLGGLTTFEYTPSTAFDHTDASGLPGLPHVRQLVTAIEMSPTGAPGTPVSIRLSYSYAGGLYDAQEMEFLGFREITETREHDGRRTIREYFQTIEHAGLLKSSRVEDDSGTVWRSTEHTYTPDSDGAPYLRLRESALLLEYDGQGQPRRSLTTYEYDGGGPITLGNLTGVTEWGEVDGALGDLDPSDTRSTEIEFQTTGDPLNDLPYLTDRPSAQRVRAGPDPHSGAIIRESRFFYDEGSSEARGDLTRRVDVLDLTAGTGPTTTFTYDEYGNRTSATSPRANAGEFTGSTVTTFDLVFHTFVVAITNPKGHRSEFGYDADGECALAYPAGAGFPHMERDANAIAAGAAWMRCFDGFGRKVLERVPGDLAEKTWAYVDTPLSASISEARRASAAGTFQSTTYLDGMGRGHTRVWTAALGRTAIEQRVFDGAGRVLQSITPYAPGFDGPRTTTYTYDVLDRTIGLSLPGPGRSTTWAYDRGAVTRVDPNSNDERRIVDPLGRVRQVIEDPDGAALVTAYEFDVAPSEQLDPERLAEPPIPNERGLS